LFIKEIAKWQLTTKYSSEKKKGFAEAGLNWRKERMQTPYGHRCLSEPEHELLTKFDEIIKQNALKTSKRHNRKMRRFMVQGS
jgi:hypothetical protein